MLTFLSVVVAASLVVTEVLLILTMRNAVKELRNIRREVPRMLGAVAALVLLVEGAKVAGSRDRPKA